MTDTDLSDLLPEIPYFVGSPPVVRYTDDPDTFRRRLRAFRVGPAEKDVLAAVDLLEARDQQPTLARVANVLRLPEDQVARTDLLAPAVSRG